MRETNEDHFDHFRGVKNEKHTYLYSMFVSNHMYYIDMYLLFYVTTHRCSQSSETSRALTIDFPYLKLLREREREFQSSFCILTFGRVYIAIVGKT